MTQLSQTQKKWLKSIHIFAAAIWVSVGSIMFILHFMKKEIQTGDHLYMMNRILYFMDMKILVPAAMTCLLTGWIYSQFTKWGYIKYKWLAFKWIITIGIIVLGTIQTGPALESMVQISKEQGLTALTNPEYIINDNMHIAVGLGMNLILITTIFISVFKPGGKR